MMVRVFLRTGLLGLALIGMGACSKKEGPAPGVPSDPAALVARGKAVFMANCLACHNSNPRLAGSVGPEIAGSALDLMTAKVLSGKYPDGYSPKRPTHLMPAQPHLATELSALHAFLNSF
jgi:mono/diheme cytochrome c family protein